MGWSGGGGGGGSGSGLPNGGTAAQALIKQSGTDGDALWKSASGDATISASGVVTLANGSGTRANLGLGTAATSASTDFAPIGSTGFTGLYAAQEAARYQADTGCYVCDAAAITPSATSGKLDVSAGTIVIVSRQVTVAAVTAITTTITSLADGTNPRWCWVEIDSTGTVQFNNGTAAATPSVPVPTTNRAIAGLLYIPAAATQVDALTTTNNGLAKLFTSGLVVTKQPTDGWLFDATSWVFGSAGSSTAGVQFGVYGDATSYLKVGAKVSWNDGSVKFGVVQAASFNVSSPFTSVTTDVTANTFGKTAHGMSNGQPVVPTGLTNTTGLSNGQLYYVVSTAANTFQLALTIGGSAIDLTGTADTSVTITGASLVTLCITDDYVMTNATVVSRRYSYVTLPPGFPTAFNWTPTIVGWGASPPTAAVYRWNTAGRFMTLFVRQGTATTSTGTTHTLSLPVNAAATIANERWDAAAYPCTDNGLTCSGGFDVASAGSVLTMTSLVMTVTGNPVTAVSFANANTASGTSRHNGQITFEF